MGSVWGRYGFALGLIHHGFSHEFTTNFHELGRIHTNLSECCCEVAFTRINSTRIITNYDEFTRIFLGMVVLNSHECQFTAKFPSAVKGGAKFEGCICVREWWAGSWRGPWGS